MKKAHLSVLVALLLSASYPAFGGQGTEPTVHVTKSGKKYHKGTCKILLRSKVRIGMKLSEAKAKNYTACKVCKPG
ncbi:MAG: hypothetical protein ACOYON_11555 [Fimbriimonas sp.]